MAHCQRVDHPEAWAVLDEAGIPIPEATAFLRHLHSVERSPNTIKGYASDLALFFTFCAADGSAWAAVNNEALGRFIRWLRAPRAELARRGNPQGIRSKTTVNRALAAVASVAKYLYDATNDEVYAHLLRTARTRETKFS